MKAFGYGEGDYIPSELSRKPATQIHHIKFRSQQGEDKIENLIALTFEEHEQAHNRRKPFLSQEYLQEKHNNFIKKFDK